MLLSFPPPTGTSELDRWAQRVHNLLKQIEQNFDTANGIMYVGAATFNPAASTTYYFGSLVATVPSTVAAAYKCFVPKAGIIRGVYLHNYCASAGVSAETMEVILRLNNTTDYQIEEKKITAGTNATSYSKADLDVSVVVGDYFEIKFVAPTWSAAPTNMSWGGYVYIE